MCLLLTACLSACQKTEYEFKKYESSKKDELPARDDKLRVLTTIAPLYSLTKNVTGDAAHVENLLPSGAGPHEYSLSPEDVMKIAQARVLIKNGVGLETWLDKLMAEQLAHAAEKPLIVDSSPAVEVIDNDPHIWLSPKNAVIQVKNIRDALVRADAGNKEVYTKNADKYIKHLEALDKEISGEVGSWKKREFVSFHSAFRYLARDYGLKQAAVIQEFPEKEPTPKHIADVINTIREKDIKVIFSEPRVSHKIVEAIARDLRLNVYSLDTLETGALYPEWYEVRMRANLEVLKMALGQR
ncbi:MAG: zinc ABC transporter substrate-binding protein [Nitrospirae bacterium]|nr:zinc ABC transporter substrate-binding protein [Nitrospirota bacterium]